MLNNLVFILMAGFMVGAAHYCHRRGQATLIAWIALQGILASLFVLKEITLFTFNATASDMFAVGGLMGLNLLNIHYGYQAAKQAIWTSFICLIFFCIVSQVHLMYTPSPYDTMHTSYHTILASTPRIVIASLVTFYIVQRIEIFCFNYFKKYFPKRSFTLLSLLSLLVSQALDTGLFSFLALYGLISELSDVMIISFIIKATIILCMVIINRFANQLTASPI